MSPVQRMTLRRAGLVLAALLVVCGLSACANKPSLPSKAQVTLPTQWKNAPVPRIVATPEERPPAWWLALDDPALSEWIERALLRNRDLVRSALRLQEASLQARRVELDALPRFNASLGTSAQQIFSNQSGVSTTVVNGVTVPVETSLGNKVTRGANASIGTSYEVDLWGRVAQGVAAAQKDRLGAQAELETARWLLTTQVAEQYWNLAVIDAKKPHLQQAVRDAQAHLDAVRLRLSQGKVRQSDEHKAQVALQEAAQRESALYLQRDNVLRTLALLLDEAPQSFSVAHAQLPPHHPAEPDSWPAASILDRLGSVRKARVALDQALLRLNIAQSNRYPQLTLSGALNSNGTALKNILSNPMGSLGLNLALPMLDWRRLGTERDSAQINVQLAVTDFREALFKALSEVDTQYNQRRQWQAEADVLAQKIEHAQHGVRVAQLRFEQGAEALQSVREAQGALRELQLSLLDNRLKAWVNQVAIFKAWGGPLAGPAPQLDPP